MAARQKSQPILQACRNTLNPVSAYAGGSEFDRKRDTIQVSADVRNARSIAVA
jgi:hypothetical protein